MNKKKTASRYYLPRDVSWMYFNHRILQEAMREDVPLLERLSFLGIYSNNLDEFFRVRVATQNRVAECEDRSAHDESVAARQLLKQIGKLNAEYAREYETAVRQLNDAVSPTTWKLMTDELVRVTEGVGAVNIIGTGGNK